MRFMKENFNMEEKTVAQSLKEELFLDNKNGYFKISEKIL